MDSYHYFLSFVLCIDVALIVAFFWTVFTFLNLLFFGDE